MKKDLVVIKIGTALLTDKNGLLKTAFLKRTCKEISTIKNSGWDVILVSSGAMASGAGVLKGTPHTIVERSLFACVGQPLLMNYYCSLLGTSGIVVAQALLTWHDFQDNEIRELLKKNIGTLLESDILPIINENDLTATEEISFGDNDQLAAKVAVLFKAAKLVILSDVDGLYDKNPQEYPDAKRFETVRKITDETIKYAGKKISKNSLGGMKSKLQAAKYATENGVNVTIASDISGRDTLVRVVLEGKIFGTQFLAQ